MAQQATASSTSKPITNMLKDIDDTTMKSIMEYFHFEDYDALVKYAVYLGVKLLPYNTKCLEPASFQRIMET